MRSPGRDLVLLPKPRENSGIEYDSYARLGDPITWVEYEISDMQR